MTTETTPATQPEPVTFGVRVRLYDSGAAYALTDLEMDNGADLDDICSDEEGVYREFTLAVTARPPAPADVAEVALADDADDAAVTVSDEAA